MPITTAFDNPDWEAQMRSMMGEQDAEDMIRRFQHIIDTHVPEDEPVAQIEVAVARGDVYRWLPAAHKFLDETEYDETALRDFVWNLGFELTRLYMQTEEIEFDEGSSEAMRYFWATMDDDDESEDEDDGED
jgi:hypothetical protein